MIGRFPDVAHDARQRFLHRAHGREDARPVTRHCRHRLNQVAVGDAAGDLDRIVGLATQLTHQPAGDDVPDRHAGDDADAADDENLHDHRRDGRLDARTDPGHRLALRLDQRFDGGDVVGLFRAADLGEEDRPRGLRLSCLERGDETVLGTFVGGAGLADLVEQRALLGAAARELQLLDLFGDAAPRGGHPPELALHRLRVGHDQRVAQRPRAGIEVVDHPVRQVGVRKQRADDVPGLLLEVEQPEHPDAPDEGQREHQRAKTEEQADTYGQSGKVHVRASGRVASKRAGHARSPRGRSTTAPSPNLLRGRRTNSYTSLRNRPAAPF